MRLFWLVVSGGEFILCSGGVGDGFILGDGGYFLHGGEWCWWVLFVWWWMVVSCGGWWHVL